MILADRHHTYIDVTAAAVHLRDNSMQYDGLTYNQVLHAHNDPAFLKSLEISGYGAIHMGDDQAHKNRLYVSLCHRHYTAVGMRETISAQERHAKWVQSEANRRLQEHGSFMAEESHDLGKIDGYVSGHQAGLEANKAPLIDLSGLGAGIGGAIGGLTKPFQYSAIVLIAFLLMLAFIIFGKGGFGKEVHVGG